MFKCCQMFVPRGLYEHVWTNFFLKFLIYRDDFFTKQKTGNIKKCYRFFYNKSILNLYQNKVLLQDSESSRTICLNGSSRRSTPESGFRSALSMDTLVSDLEEIKMVPRYPTRHKTREDFLYVRVSNIYLKDI